MCGHYSQAALRAVGPLNPPAPCSPGQSPGGEGEPSGWMDRTPGPVVTTTGRGCVSPPGLMNANLCGSICVYCMSSHVWPLQPSSLTRGRPPQPPRPLLPRPKPRWRRGAKRLEGADVRTGGYGPLSPPAPYSPGQSPGGARGAKRLDGADARTGGYHHRQRLCQPSGLDECLSVRIDRRWLRVKRWFVLCIRL